MAFTGFDFRNTSAGGTAFPGDPAGNTFINGSNTYSAGVGYGWVSSVPAFANLNTPADGRLAGYASISSTTVQFRIDLSPGTYDFKAALGSNVAVTAEGCRIVYGPNASDYIELNGSTAAGSGPNFSSLGADQSVTTDPAVLSITARLTVTRSYIIITKSTASSAAHLKHFAYQGVASPLQPVKVGNDDGPGIISTTGTTTAGSAAVNSVPSAIGVFQGMNVSGPAIPAGATIAQVQIPITTTATTTAGSTAVTIPSTQNIFPGMMVSGPAFPAGASVAAVGTKDGNGAITSFTLNASYPASSTTSGSAITFSGKDNTGAITSFTLSTGTGVTAASGGTLILSNPVTLYEKSPANKLIGPIQYSAGAANFAVMLSDGVTPNPYLTTRTYNGIPYLAYTSNPFPGTASTHTFVIVQTDTSGNFTGSPNSTSLTLSVVFAPTKPTNGSLLAKVSTPAFLKRKLILDTQNAIKWLGYQGQSFNGGDAVVNTLTSLYAQINTFLGIAASNTWFRIRCTNATLSGTAADWATVVNSTTTAGTFFSENGGGLLIENDTGQSVRLDTSFYSGPIRGVHFRGLTFANIQGQSIGIRMDYSSSKPMTVLKVTGCKFGFLFNPAYPEANYATYSNPNNDVNQTGGLFQNGIQTVVGADQLIVLDCTFFGSRVGIAAIGTRLTEIGWNKNILTNNDFMEFGVADTTRITTTYQGASASDKDNFLWLHDNICFHHVDNPQSYPFDPNSSPAGNWTDPHADFLQYIAVAGGGVPSKAWMVFENNVMLNNYTQYVTNNVNTSDTNKYVCSRQFMINSTEPKLDGVFINNIGLGGANRGIDVGGGGESYVEYNTLLPPPVLPSTITANPGVYVGGDGSGQKASTGKTRSRKNILGVLGDQPLSVAKNLAYEDETILKLDGSVTPQSTAIATAQAVLAGPFTDAGDTTGRLTYQFGPDTAATVDNNQRIGMWPALTPLIDAGAQYIFNRLRPGDAVTLTVTEANTLVAENVEMAIGSYSTVAARWNGQSGNSGATTGYDITINVTN